MLNIAVLPGDGIGPEIISEAIKVLKAISEKRNIDFYCSRNKDLSLDKSRYLEVFNEKYNIAIDKMAFVGDDYFDLSIIRRCSSTFCPSDSPSIVKENSHHVLKSKGGEGVLKIGRAHV